MKTLIPIAIFSLFINMSLAQNNSLDNLSYSVKEETKTIKVDQLLVVFNWIDFEFVPQFGGLFNKTFNNCVDHINWRDLYDDFDFGLNLGLSYSLSSNLKLKVFYNIGMLKFDNTNLGEAKGYQMQLLISYVF